VFNQLFSPTYNDKAAFLLKGIGAAPYFIEVTGRIVEYKLLSIVGGWLN